MCVLFCFCATQLPRLGRSNSASAAGSAAAALASITASRKRANDVPLVSTTGRLLITDDFGGRSEGRSLQPSDTPDAVISDAAVAMAELTQLLRLRAGLREQSGKRPL